jgi:hypothetical protein
MGRPIPGYVLHRGILAITAGATLERDVALRAALPAIVILALLAVPVAAELQPSRMLLLGFLLVRSLCQEVIT